MDGDEEKPDSVERDGTNEDGTNEESSGEVEALQRRRVARRKLIFSSLVGIAGLGALVHFWPKRWRYIVIHHSAGNYGNIEFLQKVHRQRQARDPVDAIPYHFVIGNGNGLPEGEIAQDWRGQWHIWGAHVSHRNPARNYYGIGICLVGNFELHPPSPLQYDALVKLTRSLMREYAIPVDHVSGHGYTPGERTKCPGKHFPMERFLQDLNP